MGNFWNAIYKLWDTWFKLVWGLFKFISSATVATKFKITDTKIYFPVVTLSSQDNAKLLLQL